MSTAKVIEFKPREGRVANLDDGYTRISNDLLEKIISFPFTLRQQNLLLSIARKTYGYNKKIDWIGNKQLSELTGYPETRCSTIKNELIKMNVLVTKGREVGINKNLGEWKSNITQTSKTFTKSVKKTFTKTVNHSLPKEVNTKDNTTKDNKKNTPISPKGENLAQELLNYYNQSRNARCQDFSPFIKALNKYSLDEIKLVIDWFDATGKAKAKPQSICRMTRFDGYLSDAITWHGSQKNYKAVIELFNDICGEKLGFVDEITPKRIEKIDNIIKAVSKKNSDVLAAIGMYFKILMDISTDLDICNPRTNWTMNFDNIMTVEKLDNTRSKFMKLQGEHQ